MEKAVFGNENSVYRSLRDELHPAAPTVFAHFLSVVTCICMCFLILLSYVVVFLRIIFLSFVSPAGWALLSGFFYAYAFTFPDVPSWLETVEGGATTTGVRFSANIFDYVSKILQKEDEVNVNL